MMKDSYVKNWPLVLAGSAFAILAATTVYYQTGLFARPVISALPVPLAAENEFPSAQDLSALNVSWDDEERPAGAVYAVRPALRLMGVVVSKGRRCALVSVEGEKNAKIVFAGQSVGGIVFREVSQAGCLCRWHGEDFFVPVE